MWRAIGSWIIINIFLASCRGWFFRTTFWTSSHRWWLFVISCLSSWLLASFPFLAHTFGLDGLQYMSFTDWMSETHLFTLLISILLIPGIIYIILGGYPTRNTMMICIEFMLLIGWMFLLVAWYPWSALGSRALVAIIEEWTKTTTTLALNDRFSLMSSDIIFFWLLSALGFAFIENFVYLRNLGTSSIGGAVGLVIKRMLTSRVMHMSYTWLIAVGITLCFWFPKRFLQGTLLIGGWILLHTLFNTFVTSAHMGVTLLLIVFWYLFMSRLIYKSERVYIS